MSSLLPSSSVSRPGLTYSYSHCLSYALLMDLHDRLGPGAYSCTVSHVRGSPRPKGIRPLLITVPNRIVISSSVTCTSSGAWLMISPMMAIPVAVRVLWFHISCNSLVARVTRSASAYRRGPQSSSFTSSSSSLSPLEDSSSSSFRVGQISRHQASNHRIKLSFFSVSFVVGSTARAFSFAFAAGLARLLVLSFDPHHCSIALYPSVMGSMR
jgi:hypothetical protein